MECLLEKCIRVFNVLFWQKKIFHSCVLDNEEVWVNKHNF